MIEKCVYSIRYVLLCFFFLYKTTILLLFFFEFFNWTPILSLNDITKTFFPKFILVRQMYKFSVQYFKPSQQYTLFKPIRTDRQKTKQYRFINRTLLEEVYSLYNICQMLLQFFFVSKLSLVLI